LQLAELAAMMLDDYAKVELQTTNLFKKIFQVRKVLSTL